MSALSKNNIIPNVKSKRLTVRKPIPIPKFLILHVTKYFLSRLEST